MTCKKKSKHDNLKPVSYLLSNKVTSVYKTVVVDLCGPYVMSTKTKSRYILVLTDNYSKWVEIFPLENSNIETIVDTFLISSVFARHEVPQNKLAIMVLSL